MKEILTSVFDVDSLTKAIHECQLLVEGYIKEHGHAAEVPEALMNEIDRILDNGIR